MSRVLVTGGAGFIGSHVVDRLKAAGHEPVIYDVRPSPFHVNGNTPDTIIGSILDIDALTRAMRRCDAVMHLAAAADVGEVEKAPVESEELNSRGTVSVLQAARNAGVKRVVYASTIWVYSDVDAEHVDEDTALAPPAHLYTATKLAGELYCKSYSELYDLEYTILRFGIPYGPRARPAAVIPAFVNKALAGDPLTIAGTGEQTRRFVYVEDLAEGCVRGLAPGAARRIYNLVGDEDVSIREIADTVKGIFEGTEIVHTEGRAGDFKGAEVSGKRAAAELGWTPQTSFAEGVRRYVEWHVEAADAPAPAMAPATAVRRRLAIPRPSRATIVRDATLATVGTGVGVTIGLTAYSHRWHDGDSPTLIALLCLLGLLVVLMIRVDWARRASDAMIVLATMIAGAGVLLFGIGIGPPLMHFVHQNISLILFALGGIVLGGSVATRLARDSA
ncbi:MAG: NAD-dependent epimerase/dehydratase [Solirubrobacteraceae bacterium]|nr:NAD-dependent epimerase/dehydratase [Solirubrobacteraceae bacterium]